VVVHQPGLWEGRAPGTELLQFLWDEKGSLDKKGKGGLREHPRPSINLHTIAASRFVPFVFLSFSIFTFRQVWRYKPKNKI
jgi:hypothetical protein